MVCGNSDCQNLLPLKNHPGRQRLYCSSKCRHSEYDKKRRDPNYTPSIRRAPAKNPRVLTCGLDDCSNEFEAYGRQKYCSKECRIEFQRAEASRRYYEQNPGARSRADRRMDAAERQKVWLEDYYQRPHVKARQAKRDRTRRKDPNYKARRRKYERERRATDPTFKLTQYMRNAVRRGLIDGKHGYKTADALEFSIDELRAHIEAQFTGGMSWDNYGDWHIDHIRPVASFPRHEMGDSVFRQLWALTNLRPCWAHVNLSKGAKELYLV